MSGELVMIAGGSFALVTKQPWWGRFSGEKHPRERGECREDSGDSKIKGIEIATHQRFSR